MLAGDLVLRGGGDPLLGDAQLAALADGLAGLREITGSVVGDESRVRRRRAPGRRATALFDPELGGPLSALAYERGAQAPGGPPQPDPARAAAARFDDVLEARGVVIRGVPRAGAAPPGAALLAQRRLRRRSRALVAAMLKPSDDWIAELLTKALARRARHDRRRGGVVRARRPARRARRARRRLRARRRATAAPRPGSSRCCGGCAASRAFAGALARPGRAGTLRDRLASGRARRHCRGKTGTLPSGGVSALAGYCTGRNRHTYAFAVLVQGGAIAQARRAQDRVARALASAR